MTAGHNALHGNACSTSDANYGVLHLGPSAQARLRSFQGDPAWRDHLLLNEYFDGDTGEGLGASHQTGWTALAGAFVANRRRANDGLANCP